MPDYIDYWGEIVEAVKALLSDTTMKVDVAEFDEDVVTEDAVKALAQRVRVAPQLLILVGDPSVTDSDSTGQVTNEEIPVEVITAVTNRRSKGSQLAEARRVAWEVRRLIQGRQFVGTTMSPSFFRFVGHDHLGTSPDMTLYSTMFAVSTTVDISA